MRTKDEIIVFQNQSHLVQEHFDKMGITPTLLEICLATDLMTRFAIEGYTPELKKRFDKMEEHIINRKRTEHSNT